MHNPVRIAIDATRQLQAVRKTTGVSVSEQIGKLLDLRRTTRMSRTEFFQYRLWRTEMTIAERLRFLSNRETRLIETFRNPDLWRRKWFRLKSAGIRQIEAAGVAVPRHLAVVANDGALQSDIDALATGSVPVVRSLAALADALADAPGSGVVIKPEDGMQGRDVIVALRASRQSLCLVDGEELPIASLWTQLSKSGSALWRVEERITADQSLAVLAPGSTPTLRLVTVVLDSGPSIHAVSLKIPRVGSGVDNFHAGNLAAPVDGSDGSVGGATDFYGTQRHQCHPDTNVPIAGLRIPQWQQCLEAVLTAAPAMMPLASLGWDVAISPTGPVIIEANDSWGEDIVQVPQDAGVLRGALVELLRERGDAGILSRRNARHPKWND